MKLKEQVLLILMSSKGKFVSGEEISKQLYVSRNAVWKAINSLRADGFIIDAAQNKGYLLSGGETDDFTRYGILRIRQLLKKSAADADITIKDTVTSTNTLLRTSAENGAPSKTVLIANEQTEGRGRHGKASTRLPTQAFICLCFSAPISKPTKRFITAGAAVSVVRAIKKVCGIKAGDHG
ncbi:MAG: biotin operon repressor [[Eubacterium] siraeum]